ncbi:MAG: hypothetical protein ABI771_03490 [Betaproteobacteria bacterium]
MLEAIRALRQDDPDRVRYWFQDDFFDLFVWTDAASDVVSFQLCYDRLQHERVLAWNATNGFSHRRIDDGESLPGHKMAPLMTADGDFAMHPVIAEFDRRSTGIELRWRQFMLTKLGEAAAHFSAIEKSS